MSPVGNICFMFVPIVGKKIKLYPNQPEKTCGKVIAEPK
jgi:hypothetical protein